MRAERIVTWHARFEPHELAWLRSAWHLADRPVQRVIEAAISGNGSVQLGDGLVKDLRAFVQNGEDHPVRLAIWEALQP